MMRRGGGGAICGGWAMHDEGLLHEELSGSIIGAAMTVHNRLRPGLELALLVNFKHARLEWKRIARNKGL